MQRSVMSRLVGPVVALASVLTLGLVAAQSGHGHAAHSAPVVSTRDRGWCC